MLLSGKHMWSFSNKFAIQNKNQRQYFEITSHLNFFPLDFEASILTENLIFHINIILHLLTHTEFPFWKLRGYRFISWLWGFSQRHACAYQETWNQGWEGRWALSQILLFSPILCLCIIWSHSQQIQPQCFILTGEPLFCKANTVVKKYNDMDTDNASITLSLHNWPMLAPFCDCLRAAELNGQTTVTHFSQISPWNKECKDVPLSLSWHCALFIHPILHSQPPAKSIFIPMFIWRFLGLQSHISHCSQNLTHWKKTLPTLSFSQEWNWASSSDVRLSTQDQCKSFI